MPSISYLSWLIERTSTISARLIILNNKNKQITLYVTLFKIKTTKDDDERERETVETREEKIEENRELNQI
jgi:hypothetical protein